MSPVLESETVPQSDPSSGRPPTLSILMVNYNARRFLDGCLKSIQGRVTCPCEVVFVDNASTDGSADYVQEHYPWVKLVRSEKNLGFTGGTNLAGQHARGDYFLLLNPDTILETDIAPALKLLQEDRSVGIVGGQAQRQDGSIVISTGWYPHALRLLRVKNVWMTPTIPYGAPGSGSFRVEWLEGAFMMTSAENWRALGGLDEYYFLGIDDIDFCRAAAERGLEVVQCTDVRYTHFGGYNPSRAKYVYAGFRHYHRKFSTPAHRFLAELVMRTGLLLRIVFWGTYYGITRNQGAGAKWRGFVDTYKSWEEMAP